MLKGVSCNSMPDIVPVAYGTTLHEDDRMLAILPGDGRRQPGHKLRPSLAGNLLKALGREMVTLIHNQVAIIAHEIVDETASDQALHHGHIKQAGRLCAAAADPRSEEHTSELQSRLHLVCRLLLEKKKKADYTTVRKTCSWHRVSHQQASLVQ